MPCKKLIRRVLRRAAPLYTQQVVPNEKGCLARAVGCLAVTVTVAQDGPIHVPSQAESPAGAQRRRVPRATQSQLGPCSRARRTCTIRASNFRQSMPRRRVKHARAARGRVHPPPPPPPPPLPPLPPPLPQPFPHLGMAAAARNSGGRAAPADQTAPRPIRTRVGRVAGSLGSRGGNK